MMQKLTHTDALNKIMEFSSESFDAQKSMITLREAEQVFRRVLAMRLESLDGVLLSICLDDVREEKRSEAHAAEIQEKMEEIEE